MRASKYKLSELEKNLGYTFKDKNLLLEALTHRSYYHEHRNENRTYNERLEFLGDSVIGVVVVEYLFRREQLFPESLLAKMKSYLVSEPVLANLARDISMGTHLLLGKGEESTGGREKKSILSDSFEALMGAIFLDGGFECVRSIVLSFYDDKIERTIRSGEFFDYKTDLQEKSQLLFGLLPEYKVIKQQGKEHDRVFTVAVYLDGKKVGVATGKRKKEAEMLAAQKALDRIRQ